MQRKEVRSLAEDGSLNVHSRGSSHPKVGFYCVNAGVEQKYNRTKHSSIKKIACARAIGPLKSCLLPLDLHIKYTVATT